MAARRSSFTRLLVLLGPYPWLLPLLVVLGIAASLAEAVGIGLLIPLLGVLLEPADAESLSRLERIARDVMLDSNGTLRLGAATGAILLLIVMKTVILAGYHIVASSMTGRIAKDLRVSLWDRVVNAEMAWFSRTDHGRLLNIIENQTFRATQALSILTMLISSACTLLVFGSALFLLSSSLALIVMTAGVPVFLLVRRLTRVANRFGHELGRAYEGSAGRVMELLSAMKTIRVCNQQRQETDRFADAADQLRKTFFRAEVLARLVPPLLELVYLPVFFVVIAFSLSNGIGVPILLAFLVLLYRMQAPLKLVDGARVALAEYAAALEDVEWLLSSAPDERDRTGRRQSNGLRSSIVIEDLSFTYPGTQIPALQSVSTTLARGEVVALVGPSGSGKSTLVNILLGLYLPQGGRIRIDGEPLEELDMRSWRQHVAFAGQDSDLVIGSARYNITYGASAARSIAAEDVAKAVLAHDFLAALPQGYDTEVGARGTLLSGGQRQRIALARALMRDPDLLVLDEATNAIDTETELAIHSAITELAGKAAVLIIAHRTSTLSIADRVLVLEHGRIVEDASPEKMSARAALLAGISLDDEIVNVSQDEGSVG